MQQYVVIGTAPTIDTSVAVGPFRSPGKAHETAEALDARGYVTEVCELLALSEIDLTDWSDETVETG